MDKLKQLINKLNQLGIPLPMFRDPKTGTSSVSLTMMLLSFMICSIGLVGKLSGFLGGIDLKEGLALLGITSTLYFGRNLSISNPGGAQVDSNNTEGQK